MLPEETGTEALRERLCTAVAGDRAGVEVIPVMLGVKQTNLHLAKRWTTIRRDGDARRTTELERS